MKKVTRYVCDHCKYIRAVKKTVEKHEAICFKNPATKSCATCNHLESPVIASQNGVIKVRKEHYEQMKQPENVANLEVFEYGNFEFSDIHGENSIGKKVEEQYSGFYCHKKGCIKKLTTNCPLWEEKLKYEDDSYYDEMSRHQIWHA